MSGCARSKVSGLAVQIADIARHRVIAEIGNLPHIMRMNVDPQTIAEAASLHEPQQGFK